MKIYFLHVYVSEEFNPIYLIMRKKNNTLKIHLEGVLVV